MFGADITAGSLWWLFPVVMIVLCIFMMRGRMGSGMCGFGSHGGEEHGSGGTHSAREILDKRYALGEIDAAQYERIKRDLTANQHAGDKGVT